MALPFTKQQFQDLLTLVCAAVDDPANSNKCFREIVDIINTIVTLAIESQGGETTPVAFSFIIDKNTKVYSIWIVNQIGNGVTATVIWDQCKSCSFTAFEGATPAGEGTIGYVPLTPEDLPSGKYSSITQGLDGIKKVLIVKRKKKKCKTRRVYKVKSENCDC